MNVRPILVAFALPVFVAACASTSDSTKDSGAPAASSSSSASSSSANPSTPGGSGMAGGSMAASMPGKRSLYYDFDKSDVRSSERDVVEANAKYLASNPSMKVVVQGNCDERGSREYNLALGQRRSEAVASMMKLLGVKDSQVEATSFGKEKPKAMGHDESAWQENRRSDIVYK